MKNTTNFIVAMGAIISFSACTPVSQNTTQQIAPVQASAQAPAISEAQRAATQKQAAEAQRAAQARQAAAQRAASPCKNYRVGMLVKTTNPGTNTSFSGGTRSSWVYTYRVTKINSDTNFAGKLISKTDRISGVSFSGNKKIPGHFKSVKNEAPVKTLNCGRYS